MEPGERVNSEPQPQSDAGSTPEPDPNQSSKLNPVLDLDVDSTATTQLVLRISTTFWSRLRGLYGLTPLQGHQGMFLSPCKVIHTLGMRGAIDVVFIDSHLHELKRVDTLCANRFAGCLAAAAVIELPAGYCQRYPDYMNHIRHALSLWSGPPSASSSVG